ncbi:hypothetical protein HAX54_024950 [Datura stramonium]|uniref:Uncharacterized protein n=1 Tax=Datura stramonium TaxID=4076 RepID=A0ABS8V0Y8_DATST|nr:hypothetical protein [Datura stramonium]
MVENMTENVNGSSHENGNGGSHMPGIPGGQTQGGRSEEWKSQPQTSSQAQQSYPIVQGQEGIPESSVRENYTMPPRFTQEHYD